MSVPESVATAARARVRDARAERERVLNAVWSDQPLDAEPSTTRKVSRVQAVTGVSRPQAESMARYDRPAKLPRSFGERVFGGDSVRGLITDFIDVSFLELARAAASTVGNITFPNGGSRGTGFMISDRLFLTNNHVIPDPDWARVLGVEFNYELNIERQPKDVTKFALAPEEFFLTNLKNELDFTVVAVGERVSGAGDLLNFGYCPLIAGDDKHMLGEFVNVIQHPDGNYKQVVLRENQLITRLNTVLQYRADTSDGSSGSPVFNDQWEVVALHHWGEPYRETVLPDGQQAQKDVKEGIRISAIINALEAEKRSVSGASRTLLEAALHSQLRRPSSLAE